MVFLGVRVDVVGPPIFDGGAELSHFGREFDFFFFLGGVKLKEDAVS